MKPSHPSNAPVPAALPPFLSVHPEGVRLSVKVQPRASANEIGAPLGGEL